ncbi:hypothetical protein BO82DRAFT_351519 [Aspergillus uvarum CBS 121591]|uniref:Copper acquisition factor BIM1-like domain-containing protein n=1 Tax=Aspergillus uvarum CBS 121591 TaxID=1448315 RepID=A0A319DAW9_9EURO|nr:hypothetical protein BO82DRAFT_351519 [Aspergillus uvarum CBS 121591]PYH85178.1 hypothetical protein BO82DRAFT_351519 [Aspergillus uvarum CBS 121591]
MKALEISISQCIAALTLLSLSLVNAHSIITYPGYRGNNLHTNGTVQQTNGLGVGWENGSYVYPYGMQWMYPCGGMPTSTNRTKWPVNGGTIALQPGWFQGHSTAFMYINMGLGTVPDNMSLPMVPVFEITGPSNNPYPGTICLPQVPLPADISPKVGDNATIQIVEVAKHGASLYDCVDITFADDDDVAEVTKDNCFNSSDIGFKYVFASSSLTATSVAPLHGPSQAPIVSVLLAMALGAWVL